ncbi:hypothetical protein AJ78_08164 [Emergomyces pasteurianus Ep9510]|uniref:Uncharacterized protein n=1 Tax=Emergomyces pasteurianus Ep9510 TaxID=1447872 RepID=A0A1J9Q4W3_9EURO|nr:hypothetical protein AJ78_08164 [Emergomyces pasteurianus Ep9510]
MPGTFTSYFGAALLLAGFDIKVENQSKAALGFSNTPRIDSAEVFPVDESLASKWLRVGRIYIRRKYDAPVLALLIVMPISRSDGVITRLCN